MKAIKTRVVDYDELRRLVSTGRRYEVEYPKWFFECTGKHIEEIDVDEYYYLLERKDGTFFVDKEFDSLSTEEYKISLLHKEEAELASKISELDKIIVEMTAKATELRELATRVAKRKMEE